MSLLLSGVSNLLSGTSAVNNTNTAPPAANQKVPTDDKTAQKSVPPAPVSHQRTFGVGEIKNCVGRVWTHFTTNEKLEEPALNKELSRVILLVATLVIGFYFLKSPSLSSLFLLLIATPIFHDFFQIQTNRLVQEKKDPKELCEAKELAEHTVILGGLLRWLYPVKT